MQRMMNYYKSSLESKAADIVSQTITKGDFSIYENDSLNQSMVQSQNLTGISTEKPAQ